MERKKAKDVSAKCLVDCGTTFTLNVSALKQVPAKK